MELKMYDKTYIRCGKMDIGIIQSRFEDITSSTE